MGLYRSKGVNPASGCVPMLLTLPFLFAFYAMLGQAIEIRGENFWWINDLSKLDPLFITPALMGISMFWQQKITPTTADPTQQKIMMFMPIMITVTMLFAPAGLVIYWLVSNVWTIGQQYFTNWLLGPGRNRRGGPEGAKGREAAKGIEGGRKGAEVGEGAGAEGGAARHRGSAGAREEVKFSLLKEGVGRCPAKNWEWPHPPRLERSSRKSSPPWA